jgi:rhamnosyltransferase
MSGAAVSVAIPTRDGGELFERTLSALARQTVAHELLVCDSGSRDRTRERAHAAGARVLEIPPEDFSHGATRNLLIAQAQGAHVALLSQDAEPESERWLAELLSGFALADDVAIAYGPYTPRPGAALAVRLELEGWFASLSPDGAPVVERLAPGERALAPAELIGRRGFFTDANACIAREAWQAVPIPDVPIAEDRALAIAMLRAGRAKAYVPAASVLHSHSYGALAQVRRSFDEWRGLLEVYGWREPASPVRAAGRLRGALGGARRHLAAEGLPAPRRAHALAAVAGHHMLSLAGAQLGSRADRLPEALSRRLSLEGRPGFSPWRGAQAPAIDPT